MTTMLISGGTVISAVGRREAAHRDRLGEALGSVVDAGQDVAVQVDHQAAEPAFEAPSSAP